MGAPGSSERLFKKGNVCRTGAKSPRAATKRRFREWLGKTETEDDFAKVWKKLKDIIDKTKNTKELLIAIKTYLEYTIGKPKQEIDAVIEHGMSTEDQYIIIKDIINEKLTANND